MATKKRTIAVRLDPEAARRLEQAARITNQSLGAFLQSAGDARARLVLLDWAVARYRRGEGSFSELAQQTGLAVEEIMVALGRDGRDEAVAQFLASCRTVATTEGRPDFLRLAEEAVQAAAEGAVG